MRILRNGSAGVLLLTVFLCGVGCGKDVSEPLPSELIQVWRNPAPGYKHHYFEIRESWLLFGTGQFEFKMHQIESVHLRRGKEETEVTIEYRAEDGDSIPIHLVYTAGSPPHLRIGVRKDRWVPEEYAVWLRDEDV